VNAALFGESDDIEQSQIVVELGMDTDD
jgi:hypothetical protein